MKKNVYLCLASMLLVVVLSSCQPVTNSEKIVEKEGYLALNVPQSFNFSTTITKEVVLSAASITSNATIVEIHSQNPKSGAASLMRRVFIQNGKTVSVNLNLPTWTQELWFVSRQNDGIVITHQKHLNQTVIVVDLSEVGSLPTDLLNSTQAVNVGGCNIGCDEFVSGNGVTIRDGRTYCVEQGDVLSGTILFENQGGALKVCGIAQLSNVNVNGNPGQIEIHVEDTGVFQITNLNLNSRDALLVNRGVLQIANGLAFNYRFENYSEVSLTVFNVNSNNGLFYNYGVLNVAGNLNNSNFVHNMGTINVSGSFNNNSNSTLINECSIIATGHFHQNAILEHYGYIRANGTFYVQQAGAGVSNVYGHSLIEAGELYINRSLTAPQTGTYARLNIEPAPRT